MITAKFGDKSFEVSPKKIYTPNGTSISEEIDFEETEVSGKKPTVKAKAIKLQGLSFELKLDSRFVDVDKELRWWKNTLLAKASQFFYLGSYTIGKFFLAKYDIKNITMNKDGIFTSASLNLSFTEDGKYANSKKINFETTKKAATVKSSTSSSPSIGVGTVIKPKSGVRWYYTAEDALKKTGKSGKAYQQNLTITYTYSKNGKIVCVNPKGLGWLKVEDCTFVSNSSTKTSSSGSSKKSSSTSSSSSKTIDKNLGGAIVIGGKVVQVGATFKPSKK